jgi:hypothetical protein
MIESALPRVEIFITFGNIFNLGLSPPSQYLILREITHKKHLNSFVCSGLRNFNEPETKIQILEKGKPRSFSKRILNY